MEFKVGTDFQTIIQFFDILKFHECQYIRKNYLFTKRLLTDYILIFSQFKVTHLLWNLKCTLMVRLNSIEECLTLKSSKKQLITKDNSCHRHFCILNNTYLRRNICYFDCCLGFLREYFKLR